MRFLDALRRPFLGDQRVNSIARVPVEKTIRQQVWEAPALFNRKTRRAYGLLSRIWRWDAAAFQNALQAPRYARRHYSATRPVTRRQRRHAARVARATWYLR